MNKQETPRYHAFLLRCWQADSQSKDSTWRFSLEDAQQGQRRGFADLPALLTYLQEVTQPQTQQAAVLFDKKDEE